MSSPGQGAWRWVRGSVLAGLCLTLSLFAHVVAGGALDLSPVMLFAAGLLAGMCVAAADRQRSLAGIIVVVGLSQVVFHLLAGMHAHGGTHGSTGSDTAMVLTHTLAALLVSVAVAHGERLIWSIFALLGLRRVARLIRLRPSPPARRPAPTHVLPLVPSLASAFPRACAPWRGPPLLSR